MAAANSVESLREEAKCPVCLEYFIAPVILACGHNFCPACLSWCWGRPSPATSCPQCKDPVQQGPLQLKSQLVNDIETASLQAGKASGGKNRCEKHQEALKLFCEKDQIPICLACNRSHAHRTHKVVSIEEAAQQYKGKIQAHLKTLREEREKLLGFKATGEEKCQEYLKQIEKEKQKIVAEFQQLSQVLAEQERLLLAQLEKMDKAIVKIQNENITKLSKEISRLSELIGELEGKDQKPANEFLQDISSTLSRGRTGKGKFHQPVKISPKLKVRLSNFSEKTVALMKTLKTFKDTLPSTLERKRGKSQEPFRLATVTLDPDTAHPRLILSEDKKSVRWGDTRLDLPDTPERFDIAFCVLGCKGFTSGRHYWEVAVGGGQHWGVGVARESAIRKGQISRSPEGGIWAVALWGGRFRALTSPLTRLPQSWAPSRIRVCLDCDLGQVTFIDADDKTPLFSFPPGSVLGETIQPWLWVGHDSPLRLSPRHGENI
ncbi:zinc finger protein RFP-like isoform X3 [Pelodiscus sinensis]|uniref:zinc finger protein RFP-like isoform X3 n=1 Tax=Pelodiscus sinensis TaxID=13735 RepID=UPI003F6A901D